MPIARSAAKAGRALVYTVFLSGCGVLHSAPPSPAPPKGQRFYTGKAFGSEAAFNPLSVVVNESFDLLRTSSSLAIRGTFRNLPEGGVFVNGRQLFRIFYNGTVSTGGRHVFIIRIL